MTAVNPANSVDRSSGVPLYRQVKQILADEIMQGTGNVSVMTEQELTRRFRVSRSTVRQALRELVDDGLIYRERAKGTFPVEGLAIERPATLKTGGLMGYLADLGLAPSSVVTNVRREVPPEAVRKELALADSETTLSFTRRVFSNGQPFSLIVIHLRSPEEFFPSAAELEEAQSGITLLERQYGITVPRAEHRVWAHAAGADEAAALGLRIGDPVLVIETVLFTREGHPTVWRRLADRADGIKHAFTSITN